VVNKGNNNNQDIVVEDSNVLRQRILARKNKKSLSDSSLDSKEPQDNQGGVTSEGAGSIRDRVMQRKKAEGPPSSPSAASTSSSSSFSSSSSSSFSSRSVSPRFMLGRSGYSSGSNKAKPILAGRKKMEKKNAEG